MRLILTIIAFFAFSSPEVSAQRQIQFPDNSEAVFNKAMKEINPKYVTWIRSTARQVNEKSLGEAEVKKMATTQWSVLGNINSQGIEAMAFLVLMQAAKSAQEDLKAIMANVKAINDQKSKIREQINKLNSGNQSITRARLDSAKQLSVQTHALQKQISPGKTQPEKTMTRDSVKTFRKATPVTKAEIDFAIDKTKSDLDSMSEMGEMESLRLQMAMDRMSKMMSTLSNLLKKISDTANSIIQNLK